MPIERKPLFRPDAMHQHLVAFVLSGIATVILAMQVSVAGAQREPEPINLDVSDGSGDRVEASQAAPDAPLETARVRIVDCGNDFGRGGDLAVAGAAGSETCAEHATRAEQPAWQDAASFRVPREAATKARVDQAAEWLRRHIVRVERPGDKRAISVIAWKDPTLEPNNADVLAGYVITDSLWAAKALKPFDKTASCELEDGIRRVGWYGNGLHDVLFHRVDRLLHCPADEDFVHGHSLGRFPSGGRVVDLRVFRQRWDATFDEGHPRSFTEHAVYHALYDYWQGRQDEARQRIREAIADRRTTDPQESMFWDNRTGVVVDYVNRGDCRACSQGTKPHCRHFSFKLGVLVYSIRLLGMEQEVPFARMKERLWSAQLASGGLAHYVDVRPDGTATPGQDATGEATAIAILTETIEPLGTR